MGRMSVVVWLRFGLKEQLTMFQKSAGGKFRLRFEDNATERPRRLS